MGTDRHPIPFPCVAVSWVVTGHNLSLCLFWDLSLAETDQSLKLFSLSVVVEATDQSLNHVSSGLFSPLMKTVNQAFMMGSLNEPEKMGGEKKSYKI